MRAVVAIGAVIFLTTLAEAQTPATEPAPSATAPAAAEAPAAATPTAATQAPPAADKKTDKSGLTPGEKNLLHHGYRLEVRNGQKYFCRSEDTLGSRLHEKKVCGTEETIAQRTQINNDAVRENLRKPLNVNSGGK